MNNNQSQDVILFLQSSIKNSPQNIDLTNEEHSRLIFDVANKILGYSTEVETLNKVESQLMEQSGSQLLFALLAIKIAKSKLCIDNIHQPLKLSIVFAVYKEHNRIKNANEHSHGEDFLRKKVEQLEWLCKDNSNIKWEILVIDDGCPEGSGRIAQDIIEEANLKDKVKVFFLEDEIQKKSPGVEGISHVSQSQKGGSIVYGMWRAAQDEFNGHHIIAYTDADLSTHLGQFGLLVHPIIYEKKLVAVGSRREPTSIVVKKGSRNNRGKLFIYLWKRLLPELKSIIDTQCGYKAFDKDIVLTIVNEIIEKKFAFDIELLMKAELKVKGCIAKVPIAWIDSDAASTTTDLQPYLAMLKSITKMYKKYLERNKLSDEFASFIEHLDEEKFERLLSNIPAGITSREPNEFNVFDGVSVAELESSIS